LSLIDKDRLRPLEQLQPTIIALSGKKGSGKNTLSSYIVSYIDKYYSDQFPVGEFAFADGIKDFCIDILGLEYNQCYGSDDDKNTLTHYEWENTPNRDVGYHGYTRKYMTGREVMQVFGTECVRSWFGNVWAEATIRKIRQKKRSCALITDNRFPNEVETVLKQPRGYIIRLTRAPFVESDSHSSEIALDDFDWNRPRCFVIDNARMNKEEQKKAVIPILQKIFQ